MDAKTFVEIRRHLGLTQAQLAEDIGVHRITVVNWEAGRKPIMPVVARLMECLDQARPRVKRPQKKRRPT